MKSKRVLILGASLMQVPALEAARRMGHLVITADANASAVGAAHAHEFWHVDLQDTKELIRRARAERIDAVLTCATDFSYAVSLIAEACGLCGIAPAVARRANFKNDMRACFAQHGVPSPRYEVFHGRSAADAHEVHLAHALRQFEERVTAAVGFPLVLKPVDNMGARGVSLVEHAQNFSHACHAALTHSRSSTLIAEKKLSGPELSLDSFVLDGRLYPIGTADRHIVFAPYFVETGHSMPSEMPRALQKDAHDVLRKAARALGMSTGVCKGDIIFDGEKAHIGECAARLSGGYMSGWTIPYAYGIDPAEYALMLALQGGLSESAKKTLRLEAATCAVAERALLALPGVLRRVCIPQHLQHVPALPHVEKRAVALDHSPAPVRNVIINAPSGTRCRLPKNNAEKLGSLIATGATPQEANAAAAEALSHVYFEVEPNPEANAFLYSNAAEHVQRYCAWYCYKNAHEDCAQACAQGMEELMHNSADCRHAHYISLYVPQPLRASAERGAWTHLTPWAALVCAQRHMPLRLVSTREKSINALALPAFLRAGWQGLHYTLQLIQTCTTNALKNLCASALHY